MAHDRATWQAIFKQKTGQLEPGDPWELTVHDQTDRPDGWMQYTVHAPAGFRCSKCRRWWASAQVHILFHLRLGKRQKRRRRQQRGFVRMRVFKQECKHCSNGRFEEPEFTCETIEVVLNKLLTRIRTKCYGEVHPTQADIFFDFHGRNEGPHESEHCEACRLGFCDPGGDPDDVMSEEYEFEQESTASSDSWTSNRANVFTSVTRHTSNRYQESPSPGQPAAVNISPWCPIQMQVASGQSSDGASLGSRWEMLPYEESRGLWLETPPDNPAGGRKMRWVVLALTVGAVLWWSFRRSTYGTPSKVLKPVQNAVGLGAAKWIMTSLRADSPLIFLTDI